MNAWYLCDHASFFRVFLFRHLFKVASAIFPPGSLPFRSTNKFSTIVSERLQSLGKYQMYLQFPLSRSFPTGSHSFESISRFSFNFIIKQITKSKPKKTKKKKKKKKEKRKSRNENIFSLYNCSKFLTMKKNWSRITTDLCCDFFSLKKAKESLFN